MLSMQYTIILRELREYSTILVQETRTVLLQLTVYSTAVKTDYAMNMHVYLDDVILNDV